VTIRFPSGLNAAQLTVVTCSSCKHKRPS
jgi:hypothetical protein